MDRELSSNEFVGHEPCPSCKSMDNLARYDDGHGYCFGCSYYENPPSDDGSVVRVQAIKEKVVDFDLIEGEYGPIPKRGLTQATCEHWKYQLGKYKKQPCQIANHMKDNVRIAQKIRMANKKFLFLGETKKIPLYGQWLWRDKGRMIVVTEGEIDALSVSQVQQHKWPVVSVPNGAQGAAKAVANNLEYLEGFDSVIFMFDQDEVGIEAAKECASMLKPSTAKIATLPLKDANEMLVAGRGKEIIDAIWGAKIYRPDGIVGGDETWERLSKWDTGAGYPYPWTELNDLTKGIREREITTITSGSGLGKSTLCRELATDMVKAGEPVGYIALEESIERTSLGFMSVDMNRPLHLETDLDFDKPEIKDAWNRTVGSGNLYLYDHFGSLASDSLLQKIRYLRVALGCKYIFLDHISIVVSGIDNGDERKTIDVLMTNLRSLTEETGVGMVLVSHLKRPPEGKGHEEGARVSLAQLRGSAAIAQLSDMVIGLERNQQGKNPNELTLRILKNRYSGMTGPAGTLTYDHETGRLTEYGVGF